MKSMDGLTNMRLDEKIEYLRQNPIFWSRLGYERETGGWEAHVKNAQRHKTFYEKGILVHSSIIPSGWVAPNQFDYTETDQYLELLFSSCPDIAFLPRVKLNVPEGWCEENPDDVFVYGCGPRTREDIIATIGTEEHGSHPNKPGDKIAQQSFFSQKWRDDASLALRRFIEHVESSKWASRIIGYHLAYGTSGETTQWGSWSRDPYLKGDYGINATRAFVAYAKKHGKHYDSVPPIEKRFYIEEGGKKFRLQLGTPTLDELFLHTEQDEQITMYSEFVRDGSMDTMETFCKAAKELVPSKVIGVFYGYIVEPKKCINAQHTAYDRLLASPYIDFVASPKGYVRVSPTDPGFGQAVPNSINRKKLWIDELDNRTHLCTEIANPEYDLPAKNFEQTRAVYWREFTKNVVHHQGYWWMDLGGGWLDSEEIQSEIMLMNHVSKELYRERATHQSVAEVLLVINENAMHHIRPNAGLHGAVTHHIGSTFKESGVPVDFYRAADLKELDLKQYKMIVFLNAFYEEADKMQSVLKKASPDCHIIWNYAAGILDAVDGSFGAENVRRLTGFSIGEYPKSALTAYDELGYPVLYINQEENLMPLEYHSDGRIKTAKRSAAGGQTHILCSTPSDFSVDLARSLLRDAGVHLYTPAYCTVHADNRFIYVLSERDQTVNITMQQPVTCRNIFTNQIYKNQKNISCEMAAGTCVVLKYIKE
jgi:hypothetical protein